jgi:hypothetical protein
MHPIARKKNGNNEEVSISFSLVHFFYYIRATPRKSKDRSLVPPVEFLKERKAA